MPQLLRMSFDATAMVRFLGPPGLGMNQECSWRRFQKDLGCSTLLALSESLGGGERVSAWVGWCLCEYDALAKATLVPGLAHARISLTHLLLLLSCCVQQPARLHGIAFS